MKLNRTKLNSKRTFIGVLIVASGGAAAFSSTYASLGNTDMQICNSINSKSWIWPHELPGGWGAYGTEVRQGQCKTYHNNLGQLRVYNPGASYQFGRPGQGYGDCKNGPWDSNPPDSANGSTETYKDWVYDNCHN